MRICEEEWGGDWWYISDFPCLSGRLVGRDERAEVVGLASEGVEDESTRWVIECGDRGGAKESGLDAERVG